MLFVTRMFHLKHVDGVSKLSPMADSCRDCPPRCRDEDQAPRVISRFKESMNEPNCEQSSVVVENEASRKATVQSRWGENLWKGRGVWKVCRGKLGPRSGMLPKYGIQDGGVIKLRVLPCQEEQEALGRSKYLLATFEAPKVAMSQEVPETYWESRLSNQ